MKTCPYCAEKIQDAAVVCKHCGSELGGKKRKPHIAGGGSVQKTDPLGLLASARWITWVIVIVGLLAFCYLMSIVLRFS